MEHSTTALAPVKRLTTLGIAALASTTLLTGLLAAPSSAGAATRPATTTAAPLGLGAAAPFSVLGATVTSAGTTTTGGDVGTSTLVGFPPGIVHGVKHVGDAQATTAQGAIATASADATARPPTGAALAGDQAGVTVGPGVYAAGAAISIAASTTMTLDGQGNPDSVFIFQFGAAFSTGASSTIKLVNGVQASNVFWVVTGAVSIGATASFSGTIMAAGAITLGAGASLVGRALSSAAVTLSSNPITMPPGPPTATVVSPVTGATYLVGQHVMTDFSCADPTGPGVATCIDGAASVSPGVLDTTTMGTHVYTATATSTDGQAGTASSTYTVVAVDAVHFISPPTSAQTTTTSDWVRAGGTPGDAGAITYSSNTPSVCSVGSSSGALSFLTFGTCTIEATQAADPANSFASGSAVTSMAVTVPDALQFTTPPTPTTAVTTTTIDVVVAQGTSGDAGAITYAAQTPSICGVNSSSGALNFVLVGTCTIQATQAADPAHGYLLTAVVTNITINDQSIVHFVSPPTTALTTTTTDAVFATGAPTDRGSISYSSITPVVCAVNPLTGVLSFTTFGSCIVEATQAADATDGYVAGTVATSISVMAPDNFAFVSPPTHAFTTTTTDTLLAVGSPGDRGAVTYSSMTPAVCTVGSTSGTLSFATLGDCVIAAAQAGDTTGGYAPATAATSITVSLPAPPPPYFTQRPGAATDLSLGANGSLWAIGTGAVPGGAPVYRWIGSNWVQVPGGAVTIAVGPDGNAWVVDAAHRIFHWSGSGWTGFPGAATDIAVGANGSLWALGTGAIPGGHAIYQWRAGRWSPVGGGAVTIAVGPDGIPWVLSSTHQIFHRSGTGWTRYPGLAADIAVGADGLVWITGAGTVGGDNGIYHWTSTGWAQVPGGAVTIAVAPHGNPWIINSTHHIYTH